MPLLKVSRRDGSTLRRCWGSELLSVPPEPGQECRQNNLLNAQPSNKVGLPLIPGGLRRSARVLWKTAAAALASSRLVDKRRC